MNDREVRMESDSKDQASVGEPTLADLKRAQAQSVEQLSRITPEEREAITLRYQRAFQRSQDILSGRLEPFFADYMAL